eukprot:TRINITY_DN7782_c0_g1_i1.p1 TRINITY_DN7782_c0_g1~~TRINITY_DN7782_c0_g1_i1.p1  ORF type:complete len:268 (+),score=57.43 TRINITY_DN7782_c0_g1_i1:140-943(+)
MSVSGVLSGVSQSQLVNTAVRATTAAYRGLLLDATGTIFSPSESLGQVYLRYGRKYGVTLDENEIHYRYRIAYNNPWGDSSIRFKSDARDFWRAIVFKSTGCDHPQFFEEVYDYYARPEAWVVTNGAIDSLERIKQAGIKTAIVSNFDTRLRLLLQRLGMYHLFTAIVCSAEQGVEKPNPVIFERACEQLGLSVEDVVHVGDDRRNDLWGARDAGVHAWLWGADLDTFRELEEKLFQEEHHFGGQFQLQQFNELEQSDDFYEEKVVG